MTVPSTSGGSRFCTVADADRASTRHNGTSLDEKAAIRERKTNPSPPLKPSVYPIFLHRFGCYRDSSPLCGYSEGVASNPMAMVRSIAGSCFRFIAVCALTATLLHAADQQ